VTASTTIDGRVKLEYSLTGLEQFSLGDATAPFLQAHSFHIHYGTRCDADADSNEVPWVPVPWNSDGDGSARGVIEMSEAEWGPLVSVYNRVVVVQRGASKLGCGVLSNKKKHFSFNDAICPGGELEWHVHQYPVSETASRNIRRMTVTPQTASFAISCSPQTASCDKNNDIQGLVTASTTIDGRVKLEYSLTGLEQFSLGDATAPFLQAHSFHIHYGTRCDADADSNEVPWVPVPWNSDGDGSARGVIEMSEAEWGPLVSVYNRVVVVQRGASKLGCGVLSNEAPAPGCGHYGGFPIRACDGFCMTSIKMGKITAKDGWYYPQKFDGWWTGPSITGPMAKIRSLVLSCRGLPVACANLE